MGWFSRIRNVLRPDAHSADLDREIAFHIAETADRLVERGMSRADAEQEAARRFGHRPLVKQRTREVGIVLWLESLLADLRYSIRALRHSPGFALVALLSLALGIGANTAIFSLIDTVLLKSLPVARPDQLVKLAMNEPNNDVFTNPLWEGMRGVTGFDGMLAYNGQAFNLAPTGQARIVNGAFVSGGYFATLGVRPEAGRVLQQSDDVRGCPATTVLSHGFWQSEFGGAPDAIGRSISFNTHPFTIIGVADRRFSGVEVGQHPNFYVPICAEPLLHGAPGMLDERSSWWLQILARMPEGSTLAQLNGRLAAGSGELFTSTLPSHWPPDATQDYLSRKLVAVPAPTGLSEIRIRFRTALVVLMGVVGVVLLIACGNVANLLLARAATREREIAMRLAIGAGRGRIMRQMLTESLLLSVTGAVLGLGLARLGTSLLLALIARHGAPVALDVVLDSRLLAFTILVAVGTGVLFGVAPAWRSVQLDPQQVLKTGGAASTATARLLIAGRVLVVLQVGLSLVLVVTAGLLLGTFRELANIHPGFRPAGVTLAEVDFRNLDLTEERRRAAGREMLDRLRASPGILDASGSVLTPVSGRGWNGFVTTAGYTPANKYDNLIYFNGVTDRFFSTMGTTLVAGRDFDPRDERGPRVAIINLAAAKKLFGSASPLGRVIQTDNGPDRLDALEVVGVVEDAKYRSLRDTNTATVYVPWTRAEHFESLVVEVRSRAPRSETVATILDAAKQALPTASLEISTLSDQLSESLSRERLLAMLSAFFGGIALLLALIGLYGTMAYNVTRRRKEIGIRVALGATRAGLIRLIVSEAGRMILVGLVAGGAATVAGTRLLSSFLYGRTPTDPLTLVLATLAVASVALAAGAIPAVRATREDPQTVLREE
jgi:predicted permease